MRTAGLTILLASFSLCAAGQPAQLEGGKFTLELAEGGRQIPFSLPVSLPRDHEWNLVAQGDGEITVPLRVMGGRAYGILPKQMAAGSHSFTVHQAPRPVGTMIEMDLDTEKVGSMAVRIGGEHFTTYHYSASDNDRKPYLWPLLGEGGVSMTRDWPASGKEGKTKDHPHHVSFWTAHGDVNGADFWQYGERTGWQWPSKTGGDSGFVLAWVTSHDKWIDKDRTPVVDEDRVYRFYDTPSSARLMDVEVKFTATYGDVKFGDTKEGGIVALRMNDDLREQGGTGKITTSEGAVGEKAAWGKPAAWCDYSGTLEGFGARGIAVMDSPQSFRYPTHWHVRGYGLMAANPFGYHDFYNGTKNGEHTLPKGETLSFSYRIYIHTGDAAAADVAGHYKDFANPPVAKWID